MVRPLLLPTDFGSLYLGNTRAHHLLYNQSSIVETRELRMTRHITRPNPRALPVAYGRGRSASRCGTERCNAGSIIAFSLMLMAACSVLELSLLKYRNRRKNLKALFGHQQFVVTTRSPPLYCSYVFNVTTVIQLCPHNVNCFWLTNEYRMIYYICKFLFIKN